MPDRKPSLASIEASRPGRLVSIWNECCGDTAITAKTRATNRAGTRACPMSLIEFTNTLRARRHRNGSTKASTCTVTPNPGPLVRGSPSR